MTHGAAWLTAVLMAAASAFGAVIARYGARHAALTLAVASGMMLATDVLDLMPEAWHDGVVARVSGWLVAASAVAGYLAMLSTTRHGHEPPAAGRTGGAHTRGLHRRAKRAAGAMTVGLGAAVALTSHRVIEGSAVAVAFSLPVLLALLVGSTSDGLALVAVLRGTRQRLAPWLLATCLSPAAGVLIATVHPLPATVLPLALALVAGIVLRISHIGIAYAAERRRKGRLPAWHMATAVAATASVGAFLLAAH
ncbi:hypothetical protein [Streptomyces boninensis]|uniref:hypothetical protein n=1 Tax=Streptomyces boninensis TaxID=2039455 RepID=UPI003B2153A9